MGLSWLGVDLLTGQILADLTREVSLASPLTRTIGAYSSTSAYLHLSDATDPSWLQAVTPGGAALCCYVAEGTIAWGGIVQQMSRDLSPVVSLALQTAEIYLAGCYVGAYTATSENQDSIVADLVSQFAANAGRVPFGLDHLANASTQTQSVAYADADNVTVYDALQALSAVSGGPEWTVEWVWNESGGTITPTVVYGARVGQAVAAGSQPNVTFETADLRETSTFGWDYSSGQGANLVTCYGSAGSGLAAPTASAQASDTKGRPLWEYRYQPNSTVTDVGVLTDYAAQALAVVADGTQPLTLVVPNDRAGLQLGRDWGIGDDIGYLITGPAFPTPLAGTARCIGYSLDESTVTPILQGVSL